MDIAVRNGRRSMANGRRSICYRGNAMKKLEKQASDFYLKSSFRIADHPPSTPGHDPRCFHLNFRILNFTTAVRPFFRTLRSET
jgi:hypothetical protein